MNSWGGSVHLMAYFDLMGMPAHCYQHAIAYTGSSDEVYGAKATINVWDPAIEKVNEFSLSQIWVLSGSFDGPDLNSIEAGWQVTHPNSPAPLPHPITVSRSSPLI